MNKTDRELSCPIEQKCGGCQYSQMPYEKQLNIKQREVETLLKGFGKVDRIIGMEEPYHYRNKVNATFYRNHQGHIISGMYQAGTHTVLPIEECHIEDKKADAIIGTIRNVAKSFKIRIYDEDTGYGLLRHVLVRVGKRSGEVMVVLVLASPILPSKNNFVKALRKEHPEITTVVVNVNDRKTSMILGDKQQVIYGKGYIEDTLCDCVFRISPKSFYQINPIQTEKLYNKAIEYAELTGKETVLDAYCGIGTIGIIASKHAGKVVGVELNGDAVADAKINAKRNNIENIIFYKNDAGKFMVELAEQNVSMDVVFMDPPRAGSDEAFLSSVVKLAPKKVVYVSCNPETLERDLKYLTRKGYAVKKMTPVDMFPMTGHVEMVCMLVKETGKKPFTKNSYGKKDAGKKEFGKKDFGKKEFVKKDSGKKEFAPKKYVKKDSDKKEFEPKKFVKRDSNKKEFEPKNFVKKEYSKKTNQRNYKK